MTETASAPLSALGICLEEFEYPYPVRFLPLTNDLQPLKMAHFVHPDPKIREPLVGVLVWVPLGPYYPRWARSAVLTFDCGHIPHLEHPSQFLAELLPFLAS